MYQQRLRIRTNCFVMGRKRKDSLQCEKRLSVGGRRGSWCQPLEDFLTFLTA